MGTSPREEVVLGRIVRMSLQTPCSEVPRVEDQRTTVAQKARRRYDSWVIKPTDPKSGTMKRPSNGTSMFDVWWERQRVTLFQEAWLGTVMTESVILQPLLGAS